MDGNNVYKKDRLPPEHLEDGRLQSLTSIDTYLGLRLITVQTAKHHRFSQIPAP
jgi:hypothetical protein